MEIGNEIFQFKFASKFQLRWVETNGPWNIENNLLLLKRWERGMMANNITFIHSPFWVQIRGFPFDMMIEKIRKGIDSNLGIFMVADARSWMFDQEKFMRIRVNLPLEKTLRRCGKVASPKGEIICIQFRYESLPIFCFICRVMGHDKQNCNKSGQPNEALQYGEWLRAQRGGKARLSKEGTRKNPIIQQDYDMVEQDRKQEGVEDGG